MWLKIETDRTENTKNESNSEPSKTNRTKPKPRCIVSALIFTIDNPEFEKYIPDLYPAELQLNKANTSDKETSFLDLNIKVIGSDIHTSDYDKRDDFGFPIVNFPWLSGDVPRLPSYGIYISQLVRFARCCTSVLDSHS